MSGTPEDGISEEGEVLQHPPDENPGRVSVPPEQKGHFEKDVIVLGVFPKNNATEYRVISKWHKTRLTGNFQAFIDIREWWYKGGPTSEPVPTRKGTMLHRKIIAKVIVAFLQTADVGEFNPVEIREMRKQMDRISGRAMPKSDDLMDPVENTEVKPKIRDIPHRNPDEE